MHEGTQKFLFPFWNLRELTAACAAASAPYDSTSGKGEKGICVLPCKNEGTASSNRQQILPNEWRAHSKDSGIKNNTLGVYRGPLQVGVKLYHYWCFLTPTWSGLLLTPMLLQCIPLSKHGLLETVPGWDPGFTMKGVQLQRNVA